jgi:hypothetical protein
MNAWLKRNKRSHDENEFDKNGAPVRAHPSTSSRNSRDSGPSRNITTAVAPRFITRLKTLATLFYVAGALATTLSVHGG